MQNYKDEQANDIISKYIARKIFPPSKASWKTNAGVGQGGRSTVTSRLKYGVSAANAGLSVRITVP